MSSIPPGPRTWPAFARDVIEAVVRGGDPTRPEPPPDASRETSGAFVTLHRRGCLRGCMGTLTPGQSVGEAVRDAAICSAQHDPRFNPVAVGELTDLVIEVSILSPPWRMRTLDELELGRHGLLIRRGRHQGLFLPQVATEHRLDKETFITRCCTEKAGLPPDAWRQPETEVPLFTAQIYNEVPPICESDHAIK